MLVAGCTTEITGALVANNHCIFLKLTKNILSLVPEVPLLAILIFSDLQLLSPFTIATAGRLLWDDWNNGKLKISPFPQISKKTDIRVLRPYPPTVKIFTAPAQWA